MTVRNNVYSISSDSMSELICYTSYTNNCFLNGIMLGYYYKKGLRY